MIDFQLCRTMMVDTQVRPNDVTKYPVIAAMLEVARTEGNMIPAMLDAVRAEASLSEICDALRAEWGEYREPARF